MNAAREPHSRDTACSNERAVLAAETLVMNNMQPETLAFERLEAAGQAPCEVGESPVWREQDQALYWVDIPARTIARLAVGEARRTEWRLPEKVACITFDRHGTVLAGCETGLFAITLPAAHEASARKLAAPVFPLP